MTGHPFKFDVPQHLLPTFTPDNRSFWDCIQDGRLSFPRCDDCGRWFLPLSPRCPTCLSDRLSLAEGPDHAVVASWVRYRKAYYHWTGDAVPYIVAQLDFTAGVRMSMLMNPSPSDDPQIGETVAIGVMRTPSGFVLPVCSRLD